MKKWQATLFCGIVAGIIDIVPMALQQLDMYSIVSAFVHWVVVVFVVNYVSFPLSGWLKGLLIAEIMAVPVMIIVMKTEPGAVIPMLGMSAVLGSLAGWAEKRFAKANDFFRQEH